jgi:Tfp pilus assembly protein PilN
MLERINLVPQLPLAERIRKAALPTVGLLLALILLFLGAEDRLLKAGISSLDQNIAAAQQRSTEITVTQARVAVLTNSIKQLKEEKERLSGEAAKLTGIRERKRYFSKVLATITEAMPPAVRCDKIVFAQNGGQISGSALQYRELPAFVKALGDNPLFAGVLLQDLDRSPDAKKTDFTFTIAFQLKGEADPS